MKELSLFKTTVRTMSTLPPNQDRIAKNLHSVLSAIKSASSLYQRPVRLVAVSKLFPPKDIEAAYNAGQRHFGESYIQELAGKASTLPDDIKWHFVGALQSNKCKALAEKVPNLWCVETVDSRKKAHLLEAGAVAGGRKEFLRVFIQVNTSREERMPLEHEGDAKMVIEKAGVSPEEVLDLVKFVRGECPHLEFAGLMTIGSVDASHSANEEQRNPDFEVYHGHRTGADLAEFDSC